MYIHTNIRYIIYLHIYVNIHNTKLPTWGPYRALLGVLAYSTLLGVLARMHHLACQPTHSLQTY
jgi:hypothetical protein